MSLEAEFKLCVKCGENLPLTDFHRNSRAKDGLHSYCKKCNAMCAANYLKTEKGRLSMMRAVKKAANNGYYRFGKGAIPILKQGAAKRGIAFDLSAESLELWWHEIPNVCYYCGINLEEYFKIRDFILSYNGTNYEIGKFCRFFRTGKQKVIRWMTIDRIDNDKGYTLKNIVKACWICNSLKSDFFDANQMKQIAPEVIAKLKRNIDRETLKPHLPTKT